MPFLTAMLELFVKTKNHANFAMSNCAPFTPDVISKNVLTNTPSSLLLFPTILSPIRPCTHLPPTSLYLLPPIPHTYPSNKNLQS